MVPAGASCHSSHREACPVARHTIHSAKILFFLFSGDFFFRRGMIFVERVIFLDLGGNYFLFAVVFFCLGGKYFLFSFFFYLGWKLVFI